MSEDADLMAESSHRWLPTEVSLALSVEGALNPAIFHPQWFAREKLLRPAEADKATIELSADDYSLFSTRDFTMEVSRESLTMMTRNEAFEPTLREIFESIFLLLRHTPITHLAISRFTHWRRNPAQVEKETDGSYPWNSLLHLEPWAPIVGDPTPRGLAMDGRTAEGIDVTVAIEPSEYVDEAQIYIGCRYSWKLPEESPVDVLLHALTEEWTPTRRHAAETTSALLGLQPGPSSSGVEPIP